MLNTVTAMLQQLLMQSPTLLVYVMGFVLGLVLCSRCRSAGILLLSGSAILLLATIAWTLAIPFVIRALAPQRAGPVLQALSLVSSVIHAIGLGLIIAAAFAGRRRQVAA